jgi:hypothetical protein
MTARYPLVLVGTQIEELQAGDTIDGILPTQTGNAGKFLQTNGSVASWDTIDISTTDVTGTLPVINGGTGVTTSTGTGNVVLSNSPTLVTPALGTPSALVGTNITGTASGLTAGAVTNGVYTTDTGTVTNTMLAGSIANSKLSNSNVTIGSTSVSLGGTSTTLAGLSSVTVTADPTSNLELATKQYVDQLAGQGITYHPPVRVESPNTAGNLNATYNNGTSGVGATLTNAGTQAALVIDGITLNSADRVLIYNQTNAYENGVYTVTNTGSGSTNWVLTRATDANSYALKDPAALGYGDYFFVQEGVTGAGESYICNTTGTITFGTTAINFVQFSASASYSAGTGIDITSNVISLSSIASKTIYDSFTATASQTTFTTSVSYVANKIMVFCNGVEMVGGGADVTVSSGTSIVFTTGLVAGTRVEAVYTI